MFCRFVIEIDVSTSHFILFKLFFYQLLLDDGYKIQAIHFKKYSQMFLLYHNLEINSI